LTLNLAPAYNSMQKLSNKGDQNRYV